jgi:HK97 family phage portal protein
MQVINAIREWWNGRKPTTIETRNVNNETAVYAPYQKEIDAKRYASVEDVYSVVKLLATTAATIPFITYKVKDEKKAKELFKYKSDPLMRDLLKYKSLDELNENDHLTKLLKKPNEAYGGFEFFEALYTFLFLQGECLIYKEVIEEGVNKGKIYNLHFLYPQYVSCIITRSFPYKIIGYNYTIDGIEVLKNISPDLVIHMKCFNPSYSYSANDFRGHSPLKSLNKLITRMEASTDASVAQMQNGGVPGIVWDKREYGEGAKEIADNRKDNFFKYTLNKQNKGAPFFATGEMGYIELGLKLADLEVAELSKLDFKKLCNAYNVSDILFNNSDASTESNVKEMRKALYTTAILPNVIRARDALIQGIMPHYSDFKRTIEYDLSSVWELQQNMKEIVEWCEKAWWLKGNEKRVVMKYDEDDDPILNVYLPPSNLVQNDFKDLENVGDYK